MAEASALSVTNGGTAQTVFTANPQRKVFVYSNTSDEAQYVRFGDTSAASQVGILCAASGGQIILSGAACPLGRISMIGATTGKTFYAYQG